MRQAVACKGDFYESHQDWVYSSGKEVFIGWTGPTADKFRFHLDGYDFESQLHICTENKRVIDMCNSPLLLHCTAVFLLRKKHW